MALLSYVLLYWWRCTFQLENKMWFLLQDKQKVDNLTIQFIFPISIHKFLNHKLVDWMVQEILLTVEYANL